MGVKRPYKVDYSYDGTKRSTGDGQGGYWIDYDQPFQGRASHHDEGGARIIAEDVSRNGGRAELSYRHPDTGASTVIQTYEPYEVALAELVDEEEV